MTLGWQAQDKNASHPIPKEKCNIRIPKEECNIRIPRQTNMRKEIATMPKNACPWFECHPDLSQNRLNTALGIELNRSVPLTVGHLHCLWRKVNELRPTGDLTSLDDREIEEWAQWQGPPGHFVAALERARLLLRVDGEVLLCDYRGRPHPSIYPKPMTRDGRQGWGE